MMVMIAIGVTSRISKGADFHIGQMSSPTAAADGTPRRCGGRRGESTTDTVDVASGRRRGGG
jgi:hypothetical protein